MIVTGDRNKHFLIVDIGLRCWGLPRDGKVGVGTQPGCAGGRRKNSKAIYIFFRSGEKPTPDEMNKLGVTKHSCSLEKWMNAGVCFTKST